MLLRAHFGPELLADLVSQTTMPLDARWMQAIGCPLCQGPLQLEEEGTLLLCRVCQQEMEAGSSIPVLLPVGDRGRFAGYGRGYRGSRLEEGWRPPSPQQALQLPFVSPPGYPSLYWPVRRQTFRTLARVLAREGPAPSGGPVADLGAGTGWLAYRLSEMGYRTLAIDASLDDAFGLGAADTYVDRASGRLLAAQGDLNRPPLQAGRWSMVIFGASLHYAVDLHAAAQRAALALRDGGRLVVLDSPIGPRPVPGTGKGDRHLGRSELFKVLADVGLQARWIRVPRGLRWWVYRAKSALRRSAPFGFPIVIAAKDGVGAGR